MRDRDNLIYDLIFSERVDFEINISEYIDNVYKYETFIKEIKKSIKQSLIHQ